MANYPYIQQASPGDARTVHGPVASIYTTFPTGSQAVIDLSELEGKPVRITVTSEDMYYVFSDDSTATMIGHTAPDYYTTPTALVPDIIGEGASVREMVPQGYVYLLVRSATGSVGEVRIRRA